MPDGREDCYISDHVDIALGLNAAHARPEAERRIPRLGGDAEFADLYANALPGFFPLSRCR